MTSRPITPEDFYSDVPPERIIGAECEYNLQWPNGLDDQRGADVLRRYISDKAVREVGLKKRFTYLNNGARLYEDVRHLEYATPECLGPVQATAADLAGIWVMQHIVTASGFPHNGLFRIAGSHKSDVDQTGRTNGYHENYMLPREASYSSLMQSLLPTYLASRLWAMGGIITPYGYGLSQKVSGIGGKPVIYELYRQVDQGDKPMAIIHPEEYNDDIITDSDWSRLEVRFADPGLSPTARYLGFAATSLVLRLIEHQEKINARLLEKYSFIDPVIVAKNLSRDLTFTAKGETNEGIELTAVDIGEIILGQLADLSEEVSLPKSEQEALLLWTDMNDRLRAADFHAAEYAGLHTLTDMAAKHFVLSQKIKTNALHAGNNEAIKLSLLWDRVLPPSASEPPISPSIGQKWWQKFSSHIVDEDDLSALYFDPPQTRASERAQLVNSKRHVHNLRWSGYDSANETIIFSDPYGYKATRRLPA